MILDNYGNLTVKGVEAYVKDKQLFDADAHITVVDLHAVKESIEGFVNLIYHVYDENGKSVILKQMLNLPRMRIEDEQSDDPHGQLNEWILDLGRMRSEIATLIFWNSVYKGICPDIYLFDEENRIIVMEDLMDLSLLRFDLCRMIKHTHFAKKIGQFFAHNLFYSSNLHLTNYKKSEVERFFTNPEYNALEHFLFEEGAGVSWDRPSLPGLEEIRGKIINDAAVQIEFKRLHQKFAQEKECLIHTDLHSSNVMINHNDVRIIDGEFAGFGPIAQDFGRFTGSLVLNYLSWFGDASRTATEKTDFQNYLLGAIRELYETFQSEFKALVCKYRNDSYALKNLDVDAYLTEQFQNALGYTGVNALSRLAIRGLCYDIARLPEKDQLCPAHLGMEVSYELLKHNRNYQTIDNFIEYLKAFQVRNLSHC